MGSSLDSRYKAVSGFGWPSSGISTAQECRTSWYQLQRIFPLFSWIQASFCNITFTQEPFTIWTWYLDPHVLKWSLIYYFTPPPGLSFATNYVKEQQQQTKDKKKLQQPSLAETTTKAAPVTFVTKVPAAAVQAANRPSRINNRGPQKFTEIPFEAIPLEVLNSQQVPGQKPVMIKQRPFQTQASCLLI